MFGSPRFMGAEYTALFADRPQGQRGKMAVDVYEVLVTTAAKKAVELTVAPDGKVTGGKGKTAPKKGGGPPPPALTAPAAGR